MSIFKFLFIVYANGAYKFITLCAPLSPLKIVYEIILDLLRLTEATRIV